MGEDAAAPACAGMGLVGDGHSCCSVVGPSEVDNAFVGEGFGCKAAESMQKLALEWLEVI